MNLGLKYFKTSPHHCILDYLLTTQNLTLLQFGTMALANKLGGLLKKAASSNPSVYQAIRCMSSSKLFVGGCSLFIICICLSKFSVLYDFLIAVNIVAGLSYGTDDHSIRDEFAKYGEVVEGIMPIAALALPLLFANQLCFNLSS